MRQRQPIPRQSIASQAALPEAPIATSPTPKGPPWRKRKAKRIRLAPGQAHPHGKLNDELERQFCSLIMNQAKIEDAADCLGVHRTTVHTWRALGREQPESRYGQFEEAVSKAMALAKVSLIRDIAVHPDIRGKMFILKNRYPEEYRDRLVQEMSGPDGAPIPVAANPFKVEITLATNPDEQSPEWHMRVFEKNGERQNR
jgi:hypothetical protein